MIQAKLEKISRQIEFPNLQAITNKAFIPCEIDENRYLVLYGGAGSGKSYFVAQKKIRRIANESNHRILVVRKVGNTLRHSVFALFRDIISEWDLTNKFSINKSDMMITCKNNDNQIIFAGLDDVEKLKSIAGVTAIWIEEASEINKQDFQQLDLRLRGETTNYKQIILTFNPVSQLSWIKSYFFDFPKDNATILKTTYKDNRFIDDEYKQVIENLKDQDYVYYQVYALGEWGVLGNIIYTNWVVEDIPTDYMRYEDTSMGLDFGYNNPSSLIKIGMLDDELYIFDEFYQAKLTNPELINALKPIVENNQIIADSAEPARIKEFKDAHLKIVGANKEKDSVKAGIDFCKSRKIHIHPRCVNTIKEIQDYKYREDKNGNVFDEPVKFNDHLMDALRYGCEKFRKAKRISSYDFGLDVLTRESPNII